MKSFLTFMAALFVATTAQATPETYVIDNMHTFPRFEFSHLGLSTQQYRFDKTSGSITLDTDLMTGSADIRIDARSVNTGIPIFNEHIQADDFFDTKRYPEIVFTSNEFMFDGPKVTALNGQLTIKGITRPVTLTLTSFNCMKHPMENKDACGANAVATISRSEFNMGKYVPLVGDKVTLTIAIEALKK